MYIGWDAEYTGQPIGHGRRSPELYRGWIHRIDSPAASSGLTPPPLVASSGFGDSNDTNSKAATCITRRLCLEVISLLMHDQTTAND
jgi:hypothetical protein